MRLKNLVTYAEISSEDSAESKALLTASMASYSPRAAGIMQNEDWRLVLAKTEAQEFISGVLRDERIYHADKWALAKLIAVWMSGEIKSGDEACANH